MQNRKPKIAVLGLMTDVYRSWPEIQVRMEAWAGTILEHLREFAEVSFSGVCDTKAQVDAAMAGIETDEPDLLIPFSMTYSPSLYAVSALKRTRLPLIVLNTQMLNRWDSDAPADCFSNNQAPTGVFDLTNALVRSNIPFELVSGYSEDPELYQEIREWAIAAAAVRDIANLRIGMVGYPMQGSGDFSIDHLLLMTSLGIEIVNINMTTAANLLKSLCPAEIAAVTAADKARFTSDPSMTEEAYRESAAMELVFRKLVQAYELSGITFHFEAMATDGRFATLPMIGISKLLSEGIGFGGEGDISAAVLTTVLNRLNLETDFFESWGMDFAGGGILKNHMGEGNIALARPDLPIRLTRAPFGLGGGITYNVVPGYTLKPGDAVLVNLSADEYGELSVVAADGTVPDFPPIQGINTPHGKFFPNMEFKEYLRSYAQAGGTHHGALAYGKGSSGRIEKFCRLANINFHKLC